MNIMRYVAGVIGFLLCWVVVVFFVGLAMILVFPPNHEHVLVGLGLNWRNLPGTILGLLAGIHSFRASTRAPHK